jgi:hypothetical protein
MRNLAIFILLQGVWSSWVGNTVSASQLNWLDQLAMEHLNENLNLPDIAPGTVIASPSRSEPNYYFHWVRDGALVWLEKVERLNAVRKLGSSDQLFSEISALRQYTFLSRSQQNTPNPSGTPDKGGLGEPRFHVDGSADWGPWGRPQNDGPALRAVTLIRFGSWLMDFDPSQKAWVQRYLYRDVLPADTVVKADLEYVAHHWVRVHSRYSPNAIPVKTVETTLSENERSPQFPRGSPSSTKPAVHVYAKDVSP